MKALFVLALLVAAFIASGCSELPTMKYCDQITYIRKGADINIQAHCTAAVSL